MKSDAEHVCGICGKMIEGPSLVVRYVGGHIAHELDVRCAAIRPHKLSDGYRIVVGRAYSDVVFTLQPDGTVT